MHKGIIVLIQADDKEDALDKVRDFLEPYGDGDVWDWFAIGGRWSNTLAPIGKAKEFNDFANSILDPDKKNWISNQDIKNHAEELRDKWKSLGLEGNNPYHDHYSLSNDGDEYDAVPLSNCIETVKEWVRDLEKEKESFFAQMKEEKEKAIPGKHDMSGYYANRYAEAANDSFCFESNVYDATLERGERLPDQIEGYWAVMVDIHN